MVGCQKTINLFRLEELRIGIRILATGTVKWFNPTKGYGFIELDGGSGDVFVHVSALEKSTLDSLPEGSKLSFDVVEGRDGKKSAENLSQEG